MSEVEENATLTVKVSPRSSTNAIGEFVDGYLHVRVTSPPVDGAANISIIELLSKNLKHRKSAIILVSGATSRVKRYRIEGLSQIAVETRLKTVSRK